jgi:hypothetical protein
VANTAVLILLTEKKNNKLSEIWRPYVTDRRTDEEELLGYPPDRKGA